MTGNLPEAVAELREAIRLQDANVRGYLALGDTLMRLGNHKEAADAYQRALDIDAGNVVALGNLAWVLATSPDGAVRDGKMAVRLAEQACQAAGEKHELLDTLAAAHAESGDFRQAIAAVGKAIRLARSAEDDPAARKYEQRLELYRRGRPFRVPE
jgi:tetratricopeptide (TPR) repeat protein